MCTHYLRKWFPGRVNKILIVDLVYTKIIKDAHQGNGHERDHLNDSDTFIVDVFNQYSITFII